MRPSDLTVSSRAWARSWVRFWFPTTTVVSLAICRIVLVPAWLLLFAKPWDQLAVALTYDPARIDQELILVILSLIPVETFHSYEFLHSLWLLTNVAGVLAVVGLFTRTSVLVFGLGHSVLIAHLWSYGELHHPEALYCVALVLMGLSPSGRCYSIDSWIGRRSQHPERWGPDAKIDTATWPLRLVQCLLGIAYFSSGSAKMLDGGLAWWNGATLQTIVLVDYVRFGMPAGLWLVRNFWLCVAASVVTVIVELFFFVAVFVPASRKYVLMGGLALHIGIYLTMAAPFFTWMAMYVIFINFEKIRQQFVVPQTAASG